MREMTFKGKKFISCQFCHENDCTRTFNVQTQCVCVCERVCSIIQPASTMRENRFILAQRKIDFLTQEVKDREKERGRRQKRRDGGRGRERAYVFNHAQRQSYLNVHSFNFEMKK